MNFKNAVVYWLHLKDHSDYLTEGYLGVTQDFEGRIKGHFNDIAKGKHKNPHLVNAVNKYGMDQIVREVILCGEEAYCYEIEALLRPKKATGWNIAPGGHRGPGWVKGRKKTPSQMEKQLIQCSTKRAAKEERILRERAARLLARQKKKELKIKEKENRKFARETKRQENIVKQQQIEEQRNERKIKKQENAIKQQQIAAQRNERKIKKQDKNSVKIQMRPKNSVKTQMRPICKTCNILPCAHNYKRDGVQYYRSYCEGCRRKSLKLPPQRPKWQSAGYNKRIQCDYCGYRALYSSQITVFHINGDLNDVAHTNLRSICLNCVEIIKRKEVNWRRGDLKIDY
jgi:hypothetical protein